MNNIGAIKPCPGASIPLGYIAGKPVFVGSELEQRTRYGWVRNNAQESWRAIAGEIDWERDMRWPTPQRVPSVRDAETIGHFGAEHNDHYRPLFEAYMRGHNWAVAPFDHERMCYGDIQTRVLFAVWRDCSALYAAAPVTVLLTDEDIDEHLDAVLRASGSALQHYSLEKSKTDMRAAMRDFASSLTGASHDSD